MVEWAKVRGLALNRRKTVCSSNEKKERGETPLCLSTDSEGNREKNWESSIFQSTRLGYLQIARQKELGGFCREAWLAEIATREKKVLILAMAEILGYHMCPLGFTDVFFSYLCVCVWMAAWECNSRRWVQRMIQDQSLNRLIQWKGRIIGHEDIDHPLKPNFM